LPGYAHSSAMRARVARQLRQSVASPLTAEISGSYRARPRQTATWRNEPEAARPSGRYFDQTNPTRSGGHGAIWPNEPDALRSPQNDLAKRPGPCRPASGIRPNEPKAVRRSERSFWQNELNQTHRSPPSSRPFSPKRTEPKPTQRGPARGHFRQTNPMRFALIVSQCRRARSRRPTWQCRLADAPSIPRASWPWPRSRDRRNAPSPRGSRRSRGSRR
jgi:hypothetical protein